MEEKNNAEMRKQEREQVIELGSDITKSQKGNIYTLTIIGQVEGHMIAPETVKTTKYEHVLPLLAGIEESDDIDGLLIGALFFCAFRIVFCFFLFCSGIIFLLF